ncbi:MAG: Mur ligase family protein, partial [Candidatus Kapaibacteriota bacterium]
MENVLIVGAGKSGIASALLAKRQRVKHIFVTEKGPEENFSLAKSILDKNEIEAEFGKHSFERLDDFDLIVVSPGIPPDAEIIVEAEKRNKKIISEIEFAFRFCKSPIIGVTGTNGKTTTTALIEFILKTAGKKVVAAGNIGSPFSDIVDRIDNETIVVLELSSYQLDRIETFKPEVAIILNI